MSSGPALVAGIAVGIAAAGLVAAVATLAATRRLVLSVQVLLDFLLAAGLLRLTGSPGWPALAGAAAIVALRRLLVLGLASDAGAVRSPARDGS